MTDAFLPVSAAAVLVSAPTQLSCSATQVNAYVFGSVALKAYLPDGDIDFSLFQAHGVPLKDTWATRLHASLQRETRKPSSNGYVVTNPQVINAEVRMQSVSDRRRI